MTRLLLDRGARPDGRPRTSTRQQGALWGLFIRNRDWLANFPKISNHFSDKLHEADNASNILVRVSAQYDCLHRIDCLSNRNAVTILN